tara:strand:+ start:8055 stop:10520 length:2466 start_codon:yes stop_codon:yes gene_type:complete
MSGPIGSSQWMYSTGAASFFDKSVDNSLRLNSDSSYLYFAQGTPTDISKWTINFWLKRTHPLDDSSDYDAVFGVDGPGTTGLAFLSGNVYLFINYNTGGSQARLITNRVFRDPSAWYNFHISFDRANSTDAHKVRLYINGVEETSFSTDERSNITSSSSSGWNVSGLTAAINRRSGAVNSRYHNGYFAQFYNIDGQALDPTSFIEISDGVCKPITYSGTYGNNGWLLEFKQTGTGTGAANTVGADTSGNNNHWTSSGVASHDVVLDSPTNNFAVMNPLDKNSMNISEGNLKVVPSGDYKAIRGTFGIPTSGKWYFEARYLTPGGGNVQDNQVGIVTASNVLSGSSPYPQAFTYGVGYLGLGQINRGGSAAQSSLTAVTAGKILGVAVNVDDDEVQFYLDGSAVGTTHALVSTTEPNFPFYVGATNRGVIFNFGQDSTFTGAVSAGGNADANGIGDFAYAPPANHLALCASNLPEPTIGPGQSSQADDHFNTVLYTANNQTAQSITGVGFQPDWIWIKERSTSEHHVLIDVVRGSNKTLLASVTNVENTNATAVTSFDSDGFSLGTDGAQIVNYLSETYVAWNWKAGGAASSNTDGTISSSVSANQDAGFSIATWTGNQSAGATVGHGLSQKPEMYLVKARGAAASWAIYHSALGATKWMLLNSTQAATTSAQEWNNTEPTNTVVSLGTSSANSNQSATYVGYFFHSVEGYSKVGSYIGNGGTDGTFVYTGFRPAFLLIGKTAVGGGWNWQLRDSERGQFNVDDNELRANTADAELSSSAETIDFLSNGFKPRSANGATNENTYTYIYLAFAEAPFKFANAR